MENMGNGTHKEPYLFLISNKNKGENLKKTKVILNIGTKPGWAIETLLLISKNDTISIPISKTISTKLQNLGVTTQG